MNINELMIKKENELTVKQLSFIEVHTNIVTSGSVIVNGLMTLAQNLKRMKDEELFKEAGYKTFEDYSEQACGLKRRQAYNYIKVLDNLGEEFVHSNAQIGIAKLTLLTTLSDDEKTEVLERVDIDETSVNELKQEIMNLKAEKTKQENDSAKELKKSQDKVKQLQLEIDNLKSTPVVKEDNFKIDKLKEDLKQKSEELKLFKEQLKDNAETIIKLQKEKDLNSNSTLVEFKLQFDNLQNIVIKLNNLIPSLPKDKQQGCKNAIKKVVEGLC